MLFLHVLLIQREEMKGAFREDMKLGCGPKPPIERREFLCPSGSFLLLLLPNSHPYTCEIDPLSVFHIVPFIFTFIHAVIILLLSA